ncbi:MAG: hypothetical protein V1827_05060 [Candidatus Micrarchaeota archaeon]
MKGNLLLLVVISAIMVSSGCTLIQRPCEKTTDCGPQEICEDGYCSALTCRDADETCDTAADCCPGMTCDKQVCRILRCPGDCDDNDTCTFDTCNVSSEQCVHSTVPSCCGNGICEEDCGSCPKDCGCGPGLLCQADACVDETASLLSSIKDRYAISLCKEKTLNSWKLGKYEDVVTLSENCSESFSSAIGDVRALQATKNGSRQGLIDAELKVLDSGLEEQYFLHGMAQTLIKKKGGSGYDNLQYLQDMEAALAHLENALFDIYLIKSDGRVEWTDAHESLFAEYAGIYRGMNEEINSLYDELGDYDYKYAFQVDPDDPMVARIAEAYTAGGDEDAIKLGLLRYVYMTVEYTPDPEWKTEWVQPPTYTIFTGKGDCDDSAVLLASLFLRAGVEKTSLCSVDSDYDEENDHLTVGVREDSGLLMIYESVWSPSDYLYYGEDEDPPVLPEPVSAYEYPGRVLYCFEPEEEVSYALADKCEDGTPYSECSEDEPWFCDDGYLIADCGRCGCTGEYPFCATGGVDEGGCFACHGVWTAEYGACCPNSYPEYRPDEDMCYRD